VKVITAGLVLVLGMYLLTPMKGVMTSLYEVMNSTLDLSPFGDMLWRGFPFILMLLIVVAVIMIFRGKREGQE